LIKALAGIGVLTGAADAGEAKLIATVPVATKAKLLKKLLACIWNIKIEVISF
jgi:hypothetical protein